jgi:hypothetical protein
MVEDEHTMSSQMLATQEGTDLPPHPEGIADSMTLAPDTAPHPNRRNDKMHIAADVSFGKIWTTSICSNVFCDPKYIREKGAGQFEMLVDMTDLVMHVYKITKAEQPVWDPLEYGQQQPKVFDLSDLLESDMDGILSD